jgi:hypothetical protein
LIGIGNDAGRDAESKKSAWFSDGFLKLDQFIHKNFPNASTILHIFAFSWKYFVCH